MNFEEELRIKLEKQIKERIDRASKPQDFNMTLGRYKNEIIRIYEFYLTQVKDITDFDEIVKLEENLEEQFLAENLIKQDNFELSEEEKSQIMFSELTCRWRNRLESSTGSLAKTEILIMKVFLSELDGISKKDFSELIDAYQKSELCSNPNESNHMKNMVNGSIYDGIKEKANFVMNEKLDVEFNFEINCGGFALKVAHPIFPLHDKNIDKSVSAILDTYSFVRLLGESELKEDEYLVIYRKSKNGHHFIRVEDDGTVMEKEGSNSINKFEGWHDSLKDSVEVYFAVKKEHEMDIGESYLNAENSVDFEDVIKKSIKERKNDFEYRNKKYNFKKSGNDAEEVYIISGNQIIGYMIDNGEDQLIEIVPEKMSYVVNGGNVKKIKIKNGRVENADELYK